MHRAWILALACVTPLAGTHASSSDVVVEGIIREAVSGTPLRDVSVTIRFATVVSDSNGRFVLRTPTGQLLAVSREGYLDFQYPLLNLRRDSVTMEIELRTNPMSPQMYTRNGFVPPLCVIDDDDQLKVFHTCSRDSLASYRTRIVKHNPWSPYFGEAGDRGGIMIATRTTTS
jgi:hypothetical protein